MLAFTLNGQITLRLVRIIIIIVCSFSSTLIILYHVFMAFLLLEATCATYSTVLYHIIENTCLVWALLLYCFGPENIILKYKHKQYMAVISLDSTNNSKYLILFKLQQTSN